MVLSTLPHLTAISEASVAVNRLFEMIDKMPTTDFGDKKRRALSYVRGEIEFQNVHFSYPSRPNTPVLEGLDTASSGAACSAGLGLLPNTPRFRLSMASLTQSATS